MSTQAAHDDQTARETVARIAKILKTVCPLWMLDGIAKRLIIAEHSEQFDEKDRELAAVLWGEL